MPVIPKRRRRSRERSMTVIQHLEELRKRLIISLAAIAVCSIPVEPFLTFLKVGFFSGFLVALPVVLYQLWRFITPGLTTRERRLAVPFVLVSGVLFAGGVVFSFLVAPRGP